MIRICECDLCGQAAGCTDKHTGKKIVWRTVRFSPALNKDVEVGNECMPCFGYRRNELGSMSKDEVLELRATNETFASDENHWREKNALGSVDGRQVKHNKVNVAKYKTTKVKQNYMDVAELCEVWPLMEYIKSKLDVLPSVNHYHWIV